MVITLSPLIYVADGHLVGYRFKVQMDAFLPKELVATTNPSLSPRNQEYPYIAI